MQVKNAIQIVKDTIKQHGWKENWIALQAKEGKLHIGINCPWLLTPTDIECVGEEFTVVGVSTAFLDLVELMDKRGLAGSMVITLLSETITVSVPVEPAEDEKAESTQKKEKKPTFVQVEKEIVKVHLTAHKGCYDFVAERCPAPETKKEMAAFIAQLSLTALLSAINEIAKIAPSGFLLYGEADEDGILHLMAAKYDRRMDRFSSVYMCSAQVPAVVGLSATFYIPSDIVRALKKVPEDEIYLLKQDSNYYITAGDISLNWFVESNAIRAIPSPLLPFKGLAKRVVELFGENVTAQWDITIPKRFNICKETQWIYLQLAERTGWITSEDKDQLLSDQFFHCQPTREPLRPELEMKMSLASIGGQYIHRLLAGVSGKTIRATVSTSIVIFDVPTNSGTINLMLVCGTSSGFPDVVQKRIDQFGVYPPCFGVVEAPTWVRKSKSPELFPQEEAPVEEETAVQENPETETAPVPETQPADESEEESDEEDEEEESEEIEFVTYVYDDDGNFLGYEEAEQEKEPRNPKFEELAKTTRKAVAYDIFQEWFQKNVFSQREESQLVTPDNLPDECYETGNPYRYDEEFFFCNSCERKTDEDSIEEWDYLCKKCSNPMRDEIYCACHDCGYENTDDIETTGHWGEVFTECPKCGSDHVCEQETYYCRPCEEVYFVESFNGDMAPKCPNCVNPQQVQAIFKPNLMQMIKGVFASV